jgi:hypothetical protein
MDELHPPCTYTGWRYVPRNDSLLSESDAMKRHLSTPIRHAGAIQVNLAAMAFFAIAAFLLLTEHRAHVFGPLLFLLLLACLPLHFFMHRGHGGKGGHQAPHDKDGGKT